MKINIRKKIVCDLELTKEEHNALYLTYRILDKLSNEYVDKGLVSKSEEIDNIAEDLLVLFDDINIDITK